MIRPFTCLCLAAACGSGLYLYSEKHHTAMLDRDISNVIHATEAARARIGLLRAEWALLNEPVRLQDMAAKYTSLKPMAPSQFVQLADLPAHLPAPETAAEAAAAATDDDDADAAQPNPASAPSTVAAPAPEKPADQAPPPAAIAQADAAKPATDARPAAHDAAKWLAHADAKQKPPHHVALAERPVPHDGLLAHSTPLPLAAPQPMGARVYSALARPLPSPPGRAQVVAAVPRYATPYVGSALAGQASLPPPTPYGGDQ